MITKAFGYCAVTAAVPEASEIAPCLAEWHDTAFRTTVEIMGPDLRTVLTNWITQARKEPGCGTEEHTPRCRNLL